MALCEGRVKSFTPELLKQNWPSGAERDGVYTQGTLELHSTYS